MRLAPEGWPFIAAAWILTLVAAWLWWPLAILLGILAVWVVAFFRDPIRPGPRGDRYVVAAAEGHVVHVIETEEPMYVKERAVRISIFLSVFDVHVNRSPISGVIRGAKYQTGKFLNAMDPHCADCNEQNTVTVEGDDHTIIFKQIAGLLARRIVFTKQIGEKVERGERVGLIKFGSRTDILMDPSAEIQVKIGDRVKGGASILAFLGKSPPNENRVGWGTQLVGAGAEHQQHRRR